MDSENELVDNELVDNELVDSGQDEATYFSTGKGNFLQFVGILFFTMAIPFILFTSTRPIGLTLGFLGSGLYGVGRYINWYFWYRLQ